jgi:hypothetical protein
VRRLPWVSDDRMAVLQAACSHYDAVVNRGAGATRTGVRSGKIGAHNKRGRTAVEQRSDLSPDGPVGGPNDSR